MNKEQIFWTVCIVLFNIAAYLVGRHDGKRYVIENTIAVLLAITPEEMAAIRAKMDKLNPYEFALNQIQKANANKEKADHD